jgi:mRNA interferase RelE/StbE
MSYNINILRRAQKELANLPADVYPRVRDALRSLAEQPRPSGCLKLKGREGWRIRVGDYRVLYEIDDNKQIVSVVHIGHRRDVYQ